MRDPFRLSRITRLRTESGKTWRIRMPFLRQRMVGKAARYLRERVTALIAFRNHHNHRDTSKDLADVAL